MATRGPSRTFILHWHIFFEALASIVVGSLLLGVFRTSVPLLLRLLGYYWFAAGIAAAGRIFTAQPRRSHWIWLALRGALGIVGGIIAVSYQELVVVDLPLALTSIGIPTLIIRVIGIQGIIAGAVGLIQAATGGGVAAAVMGILSAGFGLFVLNNQEMAQGRLYDIVGVFAIAGGIAGVIVALFAGRTSLLALRTSADDHSPVAGLLRIFAITGVLVSGIVTAFLAWLVPVRWRGAHLHHWATRQMCRNLTRVLNLRLHVTDRQRLQSHQGLLFANHLSYLDIVVIAAVVPARFLSTAEVLQVPLIGWVATAIDTVFVYRGSRDSRRAVRKLIAESVQRDGFPPFVIFPEGRFGSPTALQPFRHGAFDVAREHGIAYLPLAISYAPAAIPLWRGKRIEPFRRALWRLISFREPIDVTIQPLPVRQPSPTDQAAALAEDARREIGRALELPLAPTS